MNPIKSIKSRYAVATIPSNSYSSLTISGSTTLIGNNGQGYVWMPYIMQQRLDKEWGRKILRANRKEKLKKLGWS